MCRIRTLIAAFAVAFVIEVALYGRCHAEEPLFLDGNPRYPLVLAIALQRQYLELL